MYGKRFPPGQYENPLPLSHKGNMPRNCAEGYLIPLSHILRKASIKAVILLTTDSVSFLKIRWLIPKTPICPVEGTRFLLHLLHYCVGFFLLEHLGEICSPKEDRVAMQPPELKGRGEEKVLH